MSVVESITSIAFEHGFSSAAHFSTKFKRNTEYRRATWRHEPNSFRPAALHFVLIVLFALIRTVR